MPAIVWLIPHSHHDRSSQQRRLTDSLLLYSNGHKAVVCEQIVAAVHCRSENSTINIFTLLDRAQRLQLNMLGVDLPDAFTIVVHNVASMQPIMPLRKDARGRNAVRGLSQSTMAFLTDSCLRRLRPHRCTFDNHEVYCQDLPEVWNATETDVALYLPEPLCRGILAGGIKSIVLKRSWSPALREYLPDFQVLCRKHQSLTEAPSSLC